MTGRELRDLRDEAAAAHAPVDETFGVKLGIGRLDRIARNAERFGERAGGR
ncbi:hypothetical protein J2Y48_004570 [Mycoplana sp. BE70]|nr:hypothetical protein [Mycoplana sp. BE70]